MRLRDLAELVDGTDDAVVVVTTDGRVQLWNRQAERLFGYKAAAVLEGFCFELLCGSGPANETVCCSDCVVLQKASRGEPSPAFNMQVTTAGGRRWINVSTCVMFDHSPGLVVHLMRDAEEQHRRESLMHDFLSKIAALSGERIEHIMAEPASPHYDLTAQEKSVLRLLADGRSTKAIATDLKISAATVRNHVEHILRKLSAHSRTEAVVRVIREKLV